MKNLCISLAQCLFCSCTSCDESEKCSVSAESVKSSDGQEPVPCDDTFRKAKSSKIPIALKKLSKEKEIKVF